MAKLRSVRKKCSEIQRRANKSTVAAVKIRRQRQERTISIEVENDGL
jgi:hypothetical protein